MPFLKRLGVLIALLGITTLSSVGIISERTHQPDTDYLNSSLIKWGNYPNWKEFTPADLDSLAQFDYLAFSAGAWAYPTAKDYADSLRKRNVDIRLGTYFPVQAIGQWLFTQKENNPNSWHDGNWGHDYYQTMIPFLAHTNKLDPITQLPDTAAMFLNNYTTNLLNPKAITALTDFMTNPKYLGKADWFMMDFMSIPTPDFKNSQPPIYAQMEYGKLDLNQNGIDHWNDPVEQQELNQAYINLLKELRKKLPKTIPGKFLLILNGKKPLYDTEYQKLVDGPFIEAFPMYNYNNKGYNYALLDSIPPSIKYLNKQMWYSKKPHIFLDDKWGWAYNGLVAATLDNCIENKNYHEQNMPNESHSNLNTDIARSIKWLKKPLSNTIYDSLTISKKFQNGEIILTPSNNPLFIYSDVVDYRY